MKLYARNIPNMPQVVNLAKKIIDRWSRLVFGIKTTYQRDLDDDFEGDAHHDQYKRLRRKLADLQTVAQERQGSDDEGENQEASSNEHSAAKQARPNKKDHQIQRTRVGIIMPCKNAFDFIEKP